MYSCSKYLSCLRFCNQIQKNGEQISNQLDAIYPKAFGYMFPKAWSRQYLISVMDPFKKRIRSIQMVRNNIGERTGKVIIQFISQRAMQAIIKQFNNDYLVSHQEIQKVFIKPFLIVSNQLKLQSKQGYNNKHCVHVKNLDFAISLEEIKQLAADYGKVQHIDMNHRINGLNNGHCLIYFSQRKQAQLFIKAFHNYTYNQRVMKAKLITKKDTKQQIKMVQAPEFVIKCNSELAKKIQKSATVSFVN